MKCYAITTPDNPYSPFTEFKEWYFFDAILKGYCSSEALNRQDPFLRQGGLTDKEYQKFLEQVIDDVCASIPAISKQGEVTKFIKVEAEIDD